MSIRDESPYIQVMKIARSLDNIPRFSNQPRIKDETVAAHSYFVTLMVYMVAFELVELGYKVSIGETVRQALLHDFPEAVTGDIIYPVKKHDRERMNILGALEEEMLNEAIPDTLPRYLRGLFIPTAICERTDESMLVKFCDMCELVLYVLAERRFGNQHFDGLIYKGLWYCYDMILGEGLLRKSPMVKDMILGLAVEALDFPEIKGQIAEIYGLLGDIKWNA